MYASNPSRIIEQINQDARFYIKDDTEYMSVQVNSVSHSKRGTQAQVTLDTGEIRILGASDLYCE